jgi:hypothetical protein
MITSDISNNKLHPIQSLINKIEENVGISVFHHISGYSFNEISKVLYSTIKKKLQTLITQFRFFSIACDESVDNSNKNQFSIFIKYINPKLKVETTFLQMQDVGVSGASVLNLIKIMKDIFVDWIFNHE